MLSNCTTVETVVDYPILLFQNSLYQATERISCNINITYIYV
mgnify:CR=1 FL=1